MSQPDFQFTIIQKKSIMKTCPHCHSEVEDNFDLCWNCNYSFTDLQVVEINEVPHENREINCLRCHVKMHYSGEYKFHEGTRTGMFGNLFELLTNREKFELYICPRCGKVEFFTTGN